MIIMEEIWKTIKETDDKYSVSNLGNVKRNEHYTTVGPNKIHYCERIVKQYLTKEGYMTVTLLTNNGQINKKVHQLVAKLFIKNPNLHTQVNHIDENKTNNCASNLEWCNAKHNANHGTRSERLSKTSGIRVAQYSQDGTLIKIWDSMSQASQSFGSVTTCCIRRVCKGQRKTYRGYIWKYVDQKVIGDLTLKQQMMNDKQLLTEMIMKTFSKDELKSIINSYNKTTGEK